MSHVYTARPRCQASPAAAVALDFGLRVRVDGHVDQRTLFSGAENLSLQELCSELGLMISELRVRSFAVRHELEQVTDALLVNVRCGALRPRLALRVPDRGSRFAGGALMLPQDAVAADLSPASAGAVSAPTVGAEPVAAPAILDAEKLVCYDLALELQVLCGTLAPAGHRVLQDQLERASLSVVCNIAEGAGRRSRKDKRRMYAMARGSAAETAAIADVLRLRRLAPESQCRSARSLALRVVQRLTKLDAALA